MRPEHRRRATQLAVVVAFGAALAARTLMNDGSPHAAAGLLVAAALLVLVPHIELGWRS